MSETQFQTTDYNHWVTSEAVKQRRQELVDSMDRKAEKIPGDEQNRAAVDYWLKGVSGDLSSASNSTLHAANSAVRLPHGAGQLERISRLISELSKMVDAEIERLKTVDEREQEIILLRLKIKQQEADLEAWAQKRDELHAQGGLRSDQLSELTDGQPGDDIAADAAERIGDQTI